MLQKCAVPLNRIVTQHSCWDVIGQVRCSPGNLGVSPAPQLSPTSSSQTWLLRSDFGIHKTYNDALKTTLKLCGLGGTFLTQKFY